MRVSPEKLDEMFGNVDCKDDDGSKEFKAWLNDYGAESLGGGSLREGRIIKITDDSVLVDTHQKSESRMSIDEIMDENGNMLFKEGDSITVHVHKKAGSRVSYRRAIKYINVREEIKRIKDNYKDMVVEGYVTRRNWGGSILEKDGIEYFLPRNESGYQNKDRHNDRPIRVCIIDVRPSQNSIIVSRKRYIALSSKIQRQGAKELVESGLAYDGIIKKIVPFGITVEIGNIDGFVCCSEISYKSNINPVKYYTEGETVRVKPISYDDDKNRLSLSIKALYDDPWKEVERDVKVGYVITVVVTNIESYGAFVDLGNDVEGFLHISEVSWDKNVKRLEDYLQVGQEINVKVIEVDAQSRRLRVSLKQQCEKPFFSFIKKHKVGDIVKGEITSIMPFGAFINLGGIDGLLHNEDAFWNKNRKCIDEFKLGDQLDVKIDNIDMKSERISLSYKYNTESPVEAFSKKYTMDDILKGVVVDIKEFGVFVKIEEDGVDALVRNEDLGELRKHDIKVGDDIECSLYHVDKKQNKIRVRIPHRNRRNQDNEYHSKDKMTLGDALKGKL